MLLKSSLPGTTRHVLLTLSCHVNDAGEPCFPTVDQLAGETGLAKRTVLSALKMGRKEGWIEVDKHGFGDRRWARNQYRLAWPDDRKEPSEVALGGAANAPPHQCGGATGAPMVVQQMHHHEDPLYKRVSHVLPKDGVGPKKSADFEHFWKTWPAGPRKVAKAKCWRIWLRQGLDHRTDEVMDALRADIRSDQWRRDKGAYIPMPATWLNEERYVREVLDLCRQPADQKCSVCDEPANYQVGHRWFCQTHFREGER